jgi:hypothetical protein
MNVIKIEDINSRLSLKSQGQIRKNGDILTVDLWNDNDNKLSQVLIQLTDIVIDAVDKRSRVYFVVNRPHILEGIHHMEEKALGIFTQVMSAHNIKGDFTFSPIVSSSDNSDGEIVCLNTDYEDYPSTLIGVNNSEKTRINPTDLVLNPEEKTGGVTQVCSVILELMGIKLDVEKKPAHISLDIRMRILKAKKIYKPQRSHITDPQLFVDGASDKDDMTSSLNNLVNNTILDDVDNLVNALGESNIKSDTKEELNAEQVEPNEQDNEDNMNSDVDDSEEQYIDILNENQSSESNEDIKDNANSNASNDTEVVPENDIDTDEIDEELENSSDHFDITDKLSKIVKEANDNSTSTDVEDVEDVEDLDELNNEDQAQKQSKKQINKKEKHERADKLKESIINNAILKEDVMSDEEVSDVSDEEVSDDLDEEDSDEEDSEDLDNEDDVIDDDTSEGIPDTDDDSESEDLDIKS